MIEWIIDNWTGLASSAGVFAVVVICGLLIRRVIFTTFVLQAARRKWGGTSFVITATRRAFLIWVLLAALSITVQVSTLATEAKPLVNRASGSLFVLSFAWVVMTLGDQALRLNLPRMKVPDSVVRISSIAARTLIVLIAVLAILDIWGSLSTPILIVALVGAAAAYLVVRGALPNVVAGLQMSASPQFKVGDYIKIETGEEGYVEDITWNSTRIRALNETTVLIPNSRLLQHTVTNYGRPLRRAKEPFSFHIRCHLPELTGIQARNLGDLLTQLKQASDSMIYYHTHHFLEEHHYLTPEPANDFAIWVGDALGDDILGEQLASVDTFSFPNLGSLRERLAGIIEEHMSTDGGISRDAEPGREFYFMQSVSVIMDSTWRAHDLREFVETLRTVSVGSIYFHMFESKLRLGRGQNDFSVWLQDSLGEPELAQEIARLDPYTYSLEGLRSTLIQLIEKRIK